MIPLPQKPKVIQKHGNSAVFEIEGLYPGYGVTIGNALRRVLYSSLEGAAVTSIKIKGASHEFSTIPGILEDAVEIILNVKQLRFKIDGNEPQTATISVKGEKEITASDIKVPTQLTVINKDARIATITDKKTDFEMELRVEKGLGYMLAEQRKKVKTEIGIVELDAVFTPIKKVNFEVENMRVGDKTDFNKLKLLIETDGSIAPEEALTQASEILVAHFNVCIPEKVEQEKSKITEKEEGAEKKESGNASQINIEDLKLSTRTINALISGGVKTLGGLMRKDEKDLLELEGLGDKGMKEIRKVLKKYGLELKEEK